MKIKKPKVVSEAQRTARERNWNKGQILCLKSIANNVRKSKTTTKKERIILELVITDLNKILHNWIKPIEENSHE